MAYADSSITERAGADWYPHWNLDAGDPPQNL